MSIERTTLTGRRATHETWWREFWDRSWINVSGDDDAMMVSQYYALRRFITACAGRGALPIKFNDSIFTVPYHDKIDDADYRRWGGGYTLVSSMPARSASPLE